MADTPPWREPAMTSRLELDCRSVKEAGRNKCELPLDMAHLASVCNLPQGLSTKNISLVAEMGTTFVPIKFAAKDLLDVNNVKATVLRFDMADGAKSLWLYFNGKPQVENKPIEGEWNLLEGMISSGKIGEWVKNSPEAYLEGSTEGEGVILKSGPDASKIPNQMQISKIVQIPDGVAGSDVILALDMKLKAQIPLPFTMEIRPIDSNGEELPQAVVDQRWLTFTLASDQNINLRQTGHINSQAKKIKLTIAVNVVADTVDDLTSMRGAQLKQVDKAFQLCISKLEMRAGKRILIPSCNEALFQPGVSGEAGDKALSLDGETCLIFNTNPSYVYTEERKPKSVDAYAWPTGSGTFETWIYPEWEKSPQGTAVCIVEVGRPMSYDGGKFKIEYIPNQQTIKVLSEDFNKLAYKGEVKIDIPSNRWHHLAFSWDATNGKRELFLDGKSVLSGKTDSFSGLNIDVATPQARLMPSVCLGSAFDFIRYKLNHSAMFGRMDGVRVSSTVRYQNDFAPSARLAEDKDTCAYFDFNSGFDGKHFGDGGIIPAQLRSKISPVAEDIVVEDKNAQGVSSRKLKWNPAEVADKYNPEKQFMLDAYINAPVAKNFDVSRVTVRQKYQIKNNESKVISCPAEPYMDFVEIACPEKGKPLAAPILLNAGEVDCRSYQDIADSMKLMSISSERDRADALFKYLVNSADYLYAMEDGVEILPSGRMDKYAHKPLSLLNSYLGAICGSQNNMTRTAFINAAGLSANLTHGNEHLFEQVFYDNQWHVYDMTQRQFFVARDHLRAASLEEIEKDLCLMGQDDVNYFLYGKSRGFNFAQRRYSSQRKEYRLNPGESFRYYWHNAGVFNNLQAIEGVRSAKWQDGPKKPNGNPLYIGQGFPPQYSNGIFAYNGKPDRTNPSFHEFTENSFCYEVYSPYVIVDAICKCEALNGEQALKSIDISYDSGKSWTPIALREVPNEKGAYRLDLDVKGRFAYWLRINGNVSQINKFKCQTMVQMNLQTLTAALKAGANDLKLKTVDGGDAEITMQYRLDAKPIILGGGLKYGNLTGFEKQLFQCCPGDEMAIPVNGCDNVPVVTVKPSLPVNVAKNANEYVVSVRVPQDAASGLYQISVQSGERAKQAQLIVAKNSCLVTAEKAQLQNGAQLVKNYLNDGIDGIVFDKRENACLFKAPKIPSGKYAVLSLARRIPQDGVQSAGSLNVVVGGSDVQITNPVCNVAHDYAFQVPVQYRWKWDYPLRGKYPYEILTGVDLAETEQLLVKTRTPGVLLSGILILPIEDEKLVTELLNCLENRNFNPWLFDSKWEVSTSGVKY